MTAPFVDTHCHLDAYFRPSEQVEEASRASVHIIAVTNLPSARKRLERRLTTAKHVRVALGAHPGEAGKMHDAEWHIFKTEAPSAEEIGEIGLDFSPGLDRLVQERVFTSVLSLLRDRPRFITVHSRRAVRPVLKCLAEAMIAPVVLHWFSGSAKELDAVLDAGHVLSINTAMVASVKGTDLIRTVPRDRILAESDGPYARHRGKPASPADVLDVYLALARLWKVEIEDVRSQLSRNLQAVRTGVVANSPSLL